MKRTIAALIAGGLSLLAVTGLHSGVASAAAATAELDDGLLHWLVRSRWWRQVPEQPALPTLSDITHDRVTVSWTAPESVVFEISDYDVQYRASGSPRYADWAHDGLATVAMVTGLAEVTEYDFRVRAVSEAGGGDWSSPASGTTLLAPPQFVEGETARREIRENAPGGEAVGKPVTATVREGALRYSLSGEDAEAFAIDVSNGQLRTREGVEYDHETRSSYAVEVQASHVRAGTGRIALRVLVLDLEEPPGKPVPPAVLALGSRGLRVEWDAPENTGPEITGYDVEYRAQGSQDYLDANHESVEMQTTITRLARETLYEVRVRATNEEGTGEWSDPARGRTSGTDRGPGGGGGDEPSPPPPGEPDLFVQADPASLIDLDGGEDFTLKVTVRNRGDVASEATTLRYFRSSNTIISTTDMELGSDSVGGLAADGASEESIDLVAPASEGIYYYGACVDSAAGESNTGNNCSTGVLVTVKGSGPGTAPADQRAFEALFAGNFLSTPNFFTFFQSGGRFLESNEDPGAYTYVSTGANTGTLTQTYDDTSRYGGTCTVRLTFASKTSGTMSYTCAGGQSNSEGWALDMNDSGSFNIEIIWSGTRRTEVDNAVQAGAARWESVISEDITAVYISSSTLFGVVDDIRVYARLEAIDGSGGTLGLGGVRWYRSSSGLPAVSSITLDADDIAHLSSALLQNLVIHEMAHALGFGTRWGSLGLLKSDTDPNSPLPDTHFDGANAIAAFDAAGGTGYTGAKVPVENDAETAQVDSHWRISVFGYREVMIGSFPVPGPQLPLSAITVQSMADMGYPVNVGAADGYTLPSRSSSMLRVPVRAETSEKRVPLNCIVTPPASTDGVTLFELKSVPLR